MTTTSAKSGRSRTRGAGEDAPRRRGRGSPALASERRAHLVRLAAELFAEKGFQATTVRNIADEAGILSGSLYHHFDSKESIVDEILSGFFTEIMASYQAVIDENENPRDTIAGLVRVAFGTLEPHRAAITVMQNDWNYLRGMDRFAYLTKSEDEVEKMWVTTLQAGQEEGLFRPDLDPKLTYRMIRDTVWVAVRWFRPGGRLNAQGLAEHYLKVMFDGINLH
ncbi:TetR/AcrR family transcriptional regulator [Actinomadura sp. NPDC048955]|uniref:AcrR family transcriptional regulator n=1 Tax=Actinomadura luteofluorescens TaxID=46163 RepID=A0A7Y9EE26_9ACTN|nr:MULTISPECIES: TetR/AcrR family transcriptional regulator [Actinomadura]MCR3737650.1 transcriptional regulator, TetR family [Actinomadura glauciflava]NYD45912.1 AcrR family transcriptional regulator [Actinomadura luteofluorescens]